MFLLKICRTSPVVRQYITLICCNLLTISVGLSNGWATINFLELQSENSTFPTGSLSLDQLAITLSVYSFGALIGNFAVAPISETIGIKHTIHLFGLPIILNALLIIWAKTAYFLYVSRLLDGFVGGALVVALPLLVNEISFDNVRGALCAMYAPSYNIGLIISFFIGNYMTILDQARLQLVLPAIFVMAMFLFPESPEFWSKRNKPKLAKKSNYFYKGDPVVDSSASEQIENQNNINNSAQKRFNWKYTNYMLKQFRRPQAKRAMFIAFTSTIISILCSIWVLNSYATDIFNKTGSILSEKASTLGNAFVTLFASSLFFFLVERINRKTLYIGSAILTALSFILFAVYCSFWLKQPGYEWLPHFCFACIIFFNYTGLVMIPYTISIEIFPKEIRAECISISMSLLWVIMFIISYIFPFFLNSVGLSACMITLGVICLLNVGFGIYFVPETRGKSYEEIMQLLNQ